MAVTMVDGAVESDDYELTEDERVESLLSPLFYGFIEFEEEFARYVLDLGLSDVEVETQAVRFDVIDSPTAKAYAALLRHVPEQRRLRRMFATLDEMYPQGLPPEGVSVDQLNEDYRKIKAQP